MPISTLGCGAYQAEYEVISVYDYPYRSKSSCDSEYSFTTDYLGPALCSATLYTVCVKETCPEETTGTTCKKEMTGRRYQFYQIEMIPLTF